MLVNLQDVVDGALANSLSAMAGMLVRPRASRRTGAELDLAVWMDTDALAGNELPGARLELPEMSDEDAADLEAAFKRHEVQGALQALLAARLTDAPEADAARAREVLAARLAAREAVRLALSGSEAPAARRVDRRSQPPGTVGMSETSRPAGVTPSAGAAQPESASEPASGRYAEQLSEYFDDKISALVASLEARVGFTGLAQVRAEAYNARIVALLGAIERQVAALAEQTTRARDDVLWLGRYRSQARARHGYLYPPDFERRRKLPAENIYVDPQIVEDSGTPIVPDLHVTDQEPTEDDQSGFGPYLPEEPTIPVMDLPGLLDRTVLLGAPGAGKTTAANMLANFFASDATRRVPFLVTVREYAAKTMPERSVVRHIERDLESVYQCPAPAGLIERLLLTGQAVVIFDGLDELLDTKRRRVVSELIEQFCSAFPLAPTLVTSRLIGYSEARLDDRQFTCYQLLGFSHDAVGEYASKWFASQDGISPQEAEATARAFLMESSKTRDLQTSPLLLSLMCILYRGAGSLPGDRAGIYAKCAELQLRKWDEQRDLYQKVRAEYLVERIIHHLAWWLFTREDSRTVATERELITETAEFLQGHGFEDEDQARIAAREFVEFCRGRMWVFTEAGTTGDGERLYAFTHRTFHEYFAACYLATASDTPEDLAHSLASRLSSQGWSVVGELAVQIKDRNSAHGADRIYTVLLDAASVTEDSGRLLTFLALCLESARPTPPVVRRLVGTALRCTINGNMPQPESYALWFRLVSSMSYSQLIADETSSQVATVAGGDSITDRANALQFALEIGTVYGNANDFWWRWTFQHADHYAATITTVAERAIALRTMALLFDIISLDQALAMPGGLDALMSRQPGMVSSTAVSPYPVWLCNQLTNFPEENQLVSGLAAIGRHLVKHPALPWVRVHTRDCNLNLLRAYPPDPRIAFDELSGLGFTAIYSVNCEIYMEGRPQLRECPMPAGFSQLFDDWAEGRVDFVQVMGEESS